MLLIDRVVLIAGVGTGKTGAAPTWASISVRFRVRPGEYGRFTSAGGFYAEN
jgi:hypothetical protein